MVDEHVGGELVFERSSGEQLGVAAVFAVAAVAVLALLFMGGGTQVVWLPVGIAVASGAAALAVSSLTVETSREQIVIHRLGEDQSMLWAEVSAYYLPKRTSRLVLTTTTGPWGMLTLVNGDDPRLSMRLVSAGGGRVNVPKRMRSGTDGAPLGKLVQKRVVTRIYPPIRTAFDEGKTVEFGPVSLSQQNGLVFKSTRVAPSELGRYSLLLHRGRVVLAQSRRRRGDPSVRWDRIPNVDVFLTLFYNLKNVVPTSSWA
jgi:hypothetical protein